MKQQPSMWLYLLIRAEQGNKKALCMVNFVTYLALMFFCVGVFCVFFALFELWGTLMGWL